MKESLHHHHEHDHPIPKDRQAICPVTGDTVDVAVAKKIGHVREYNGKKIYFCCDGCVKLFDERADPLRYAV